ncbi:Ubiquitin-like-conjugating enzyme ATG10 [Linum perenne]
MRSSLLPNFFFFPSLPLFRLQTSEKEARVIGRSPEAIKTWVMDEASSWDGTLSLSNFSASARAFADKWKLLNNPAFPPWVWVNSHKPSVFTSSHQVEEGYLSLENMCIVNPTKDNVDQVEETNLPEKEEQESTDSATLHHYFDLHIIYSASFRVPVLYFRAYRSDGGNLGLNEIERALPANSVKLLLESKWTFITQEEHPYLNRPWCKLHPCGTSEWMKLLFQAEKGVKKPGLDLYLLSWFSVVAPMVGIRIPIHMLINGSQ